MMRESLAEMARRQGQEPDYDAIERQLKPVRQIAQHISAWEKLQRGKRADNPADPEVTQPALL